MAEYDPARSGGSWDGEEEYGLGEGDQQDGSEHSEQDEAQYSLHSAPHASGDSSSSDSADGADGDVVEYDPAAVASPSPSASSYPQVVEQQPPPPLKPSPQPAAKKPKTAGGFLVGDSDSEDDMPTSTGGAAHLKSPLRTSVNAPAPVDISSDHTPTVPQMTPAIATNPTVPGPASAQPSSQINPRARIALLEDRISADPRGATDAWMALISEYRFKNNIEDARKVYERFLDVFPTAADVWVGYLEMELGMNNLAETERIFGMCLMTTPNVALWSKYLDYIRRRNDLTSEGSGQARQVIHQAYEFVIENIGLDKDSGKIWTDYIEFIKSGPGTAGGSGWQDMQKMDQLRRAYQRAICVPIANVNSLWKEYDQFEMGLNKITGRKYLAEKSPAYMSAKSANTALDNIIRGLHRINVPRLPPAPGFDGDQEYMEQVTLWNKWIAWEKSDPLDIQDDKDQPELLKKRILYVYNQALMALRFWPEMWVEAAEWCFDNDIVKDGAAVGLGMLTRGIAANPESVLLALKHGDHIESTYPSEENDDAKVARGVAIREPYNQCLDTLYGIIKGLKERETAEVARIEEAAALDAANASAAGNGDDDDEYDVDDVEKATKERAKNDQIKAIQQGFAAQTQLISRSITFVWIAYIRAMRRIQGKGKPGTPLGGMRQAFTEARQRGRLTSDVYAAVAQMEWTIYKDVAGGKIFERGAKLFPDDETFTLEYIKYLHSKEDITNARVLFETVVNRLTQKPELVHKAKPLCAYFHKYESNFGELAQIAKLEKRMAELYPEDPKLAHFNARFSTDKFDPIAARIIVSPATQLRPKLAILPSIEAPTSIQNSPAPQLRGQSPRPQMLPATNSPKRPFPGDDFEDANPPRKMQRADQYEFQRGVSPLKGAAGRRLDQQRRMQGQGGSAALHNAAPTPLPTDINFLLSLIPGADSYRAERFKSAELVRLLRDTFVPDYSTYKSQQKGEFAPSLRGGVGQSHNRHVSSDHNQYGLQSRDSPNPQGRPASPFGRGPPGTTTYRQSSLRPGSSGSYEPPPAVYAQQGAPAQQPSYAQGQPPPHGQFDAGAWSQYPPAGTSAQPGYAPPSSVGYGQNRPPSQQPSFPQQFRY